MTVLRMTTAVWAVIVSGIAIGSVGAQSPAPTAELDTFMRQVLLRRDDNWKKIQQYILDEQERIDFRGPGEMLLWGAKREYLWYPREGFFVRSPVRFNGVAIGEADRERYEQNFLRRVKNRDERSRERNSETPGTADASPSEFQNLLQQTREPQFISSAYFLQFKFEGGQYALVGQETIDTRRVLRIEYYPTKLFSDDPATRAEARANQAAGRDARSEALGNEVQRLMNKVSIVTLWVEPSQKQIVKYTFDNIGLEFLPASWLVRVTDLRANMLMTEAFPDVWLPGRIDMAAAFVLAPGPFSLTYDIHYSGYREATTGGRYLGPKSR
jgi:hypothetical protein